MSLPGFAEVEELAKVLVKVAVKTDELSIDPKTGSRIIEAWNNLLEFDRDVHAQKFCDLYMGPFTATKLARSKYRVRHKSVHIFNPAPGGENF